MIAGAGHDALVIGDEQVVVLDFAGVQVPEPGISGSGLIPSPTTLHRSRVAKDATGSPSQGLLMLAAAALEFT